MKIFQFDKKVWDNGETSHTWQFGIVKNTSLLWVNYENPTAHHWSSGDFISFFLFFPILFLGQNLITTNSVLLLNFLRNTLMGGMND